MHEKKTKKHKKVLVLGFDAATFDIIKPMVEEGRLPNFKKMMKEGSYGDLQSTIPPVTPPAWASFMTGKNPGKHGVYNFAFHSSDPSEDDGDHFVNFYSIKSNTIWEILSQKGRKNIVINLPATYPINTNMNGIMISGMLTPNDTQDFIFPRELNDEIRQNVCTYRVDSHPHAMEWSNKNLKERIEHYLEVERDRRDAALYLLKEHPWDLFIVMFGFTDKILHSIYYYLDKNYPESKEFREYLYKTYEEADNILGRFLSVIDKDTTLAVVSDHGFGHLKKGFNTNKWLFDKGYMVLRKVTLSNFKELYQFKIRRLPIEKLLMKLKLGFFRKKLPFSLTEKLVRIPRFHRRISRSVVDWSKTKAYSRDYGIRINLEGREKSGIVKIGEEYEKLREEIIENLYELRDPETNEKIVDWALKREDIFSGPYLENAPDLMFLMRNLEYTQRDSYYFKHLFRKDIKLSTHKMNGIFLIKGEGIKPDCEIADANIIDVAPTILYSMMCPVPDDMDGKVLSACFEDHIMKNIPLQFEPPLPLLRDDKKIRSVFSEEDEKEIMHALKGLGYLG